MALPTQKEIQVPLLHEIEVRGGEARPETELYRAVASHFPQITEADLKEEVASGINRWEKHVNFARLQLVHRGEIDKSVRGIWRITERGRRRLRGGGEVLLVDTAGPSAIPTSPTRHEELKQKMVEIGNKLGYHASTEERGPVYQHDVLWKRGAYKKDPSHVIEICAGGSLPKDFDALNWANQNVGASGILVAVDDADYRKAIQRFENQSDIVVVKAETVDRLHELVMTDVEFLKLIFGEKS